jgi:hypothetical protein
LIEVKLSKKDIIGRLKQQKDNIRESKPQAQQVAAILSIQNIYTHTHPKPLSYTLNPLLKLFVQDGADEIQEISEMDARLIRTTLFLLPLLSILSPR